MRSPAAGYASGDARTRAGAELMIDPADASPAPISDYGLIGDTRTAALCSSRGSIDWLCLPRFDSDPIFGRLIGGDRAGSFVIRLGERADLVSRRYLPASTVLETRWRTRSSQVTLTEGMVSEVEHGLLPTMLLVRRLECRGGSVPVVVRFDPRGGEHHTAPRIQRRSSVLVCEWRSLAVGLHVEPEVAIEPGRVAEMTLAPGQPLTIAMTAARGEPLVYISPARAWEALERDHNLWRNWVNGIGDCGPFHDSVVRSLITLRLLTYSPSGAPVAAATTSLPEELGGERNWDYRYAWVRDASLGIAAFLGAGRVEEARAFLLWLLHASRLDRPRLPPMLSLDGKRAAPERVLDWPGYAESRPVRVGNNARDQHQLDCYGWVVDAAARLHEAGHGLYTETWRTMAGFADFVASRWLEPDAGLWEVRSPPAHHVHSKLMAWLALDRALQLSSHYRTRRRRTSRWAAAREALLHDVGRHGYDPTRKTFVRAYGSDDLDAALVRVPLLGFEHPGADRVIGTLGAVRHELGAGGPLLYRYQPGSDGVHGGEAAFLPCSYWLAESLAVSGRDDDAADVLEQLQRYDVGLGLLPEEIDPASGAFLGNFPQAFTHAGHVTAALAIRDARSARPSARIDAA
jgi:GH15 family glucan-1,4-alpha-glucosidase